MRKSPEIRDEWEFLQSKSNNKSITILNERIDDLEAELNRVYTLSFKDRFKFLFKGESYVRS